MGWGAAVRIELDDAERSELQARARRRKIAWADAMRAAIVLLAADGMTNLSIAERLGTRVSRWRCGAGGLRRSVWTGWPTSPARVLRARSATRRSPRW